MNRGRRVAADSRGEPSNTVSPNLKTENPNPHPKALHIARKKCICLTVGVKRTRCSKGKLKSLKVFFLLDCCCCCCQCCCSSCCCCLDSSSAYIDDYLQPLFRLTLKGHRHQKDIEQQSCQYSANNISSSNRMQKAGVYALLKRQPLFALRNSVCVKL